MPNNETAPKPTAPPAVASTLRVDLPLDIRQALGAAAWRNRRVPQAQVEVLLREGLERHGFLAPLDEPEPVRRDG